MSVAYERWAVSIAVLTEVVIKGSSKRLHYKMIYDSDHTVMMENNNTYHAPTFPCSCVVLSKSLLHFLYLLTSSLVYVFCSPI
jgi:hypothetical protein